MISLTVDQKFVDDLRDDFVINETENLYKFLNGDPVKAFYLGLNVTEWFEELDKKQQYLHSKQIRHNIDEIKKYQSQIEFWTKRYPEEEASFLEISEYILNNMIIEKDSEELDLVKIAFSFGITISQQENSK